MPLEILPKGAGQGVFFQSCVTEFQAEPVGEGGDNMRDRVTRLEARVDGLTEAVNVLGKKTDGLSDKINELSIEAKENHASLLGKIETSNASLLGEIKAINGSMHGKMDASNASLLGEIKAINARIAPLKVLFYGIVTAVGAAMLFALFSYFLPAASGKGDSVFQTSPEPSISVPAQESPSPILPQANP
jgi:hypothetical protein